MHSFALSFSLPSRNASFFPRAIFPRFFPLSLSLEADNGPARLAARLKSNVCHVHLPRRLVIGARERQLHLKKSMLRWKVSYGLRNPCLFRVTSGLAVLSTLHLAESSFSWVIYARLLIYTRLFVSNFNSNSRIITNDNDALWFSLSLFQEDFFQEIGLRSNCRYELFIGR